VPLPLLKFGSGLCPLTGEADLLAASVAAISDGEVDPRRLPSTPDLPAGGESNVLLPPLRLLNCSAESLWATTLLCGCSSPDADRGANPASCMLPFPLPLLLAPVACRLTLAFPTSTADFVPDAACSLAACVAASSAPLPPRSHVLCTGIVGFPFSPEPVLLLLVLIA
jgi:hypothetical protein